VKYCLVGVEVAASPGEHFVFEEALIAELGVEDEA